jgi:hypothetical protein
MPVSPVRQQRIARFEHKGRKMKILGEIPVENNLENISRRGNTKVETELGPISKGDVDPVAKFARASVRTWIRAIRGKLNQKAVRSYLQTEKERRLREKVIWEREIARKMEEEENRKREERRQNAALSRLSRLKQQEEYRRGLISTYQPYFLKKTDSTAPPAQDHISSQDPISLLDVAVTVNMTPHPPRPFKPIESIHIRAKAYDELESLLGSTIQRTWQDIATVNKDEVLTSSSKESSISTMFRSMMGIEIKVDEQNKLKTEVDGFDLRAPDLQAPKPGDGKLSPSKRWMKKSMNNINPLESPESVLSSPTKKKEKNRRATKNSKRNSLRSPKKKRKSTIKK